MIDKINFKGHLTVQAIKDGKIVDEWADKNMIMEGARVDMAKLIAGMTSGTYINKIVLGTRGHNNDYVVPKTITEGFVKERTRIFSEPISYTSGTIDVITGDIVESGGTYYEYIVENEGVVSTITPDFSNTAEWNDIGSTAPFIYPIEFSTTGSNGDFNIVSEPDSTLGSSTVNVVQDLTSVTYTVDVPQELANNGEVAVFTEAALYAGDYIFSMKTFRGKIKEESVQLRVIWKLLF